jgi:chromate transporter
MGKNILTRRWQWIVAVLAFLAVVIIQATVIEVVLASGLVGLYIDSLAEKQLKQLKQLRTLASRRRIRIRMRLTNQRRARFRHDFVGGYLTRALAEERLSRALEADEKPETTDADQPREDSTGSDSKLRSLTILAFAMPILAKLALLLSIAVIFLRIGAVTFGGGFVMVPLIESEVVDGHHWLTHQEFADATALGQITPGPVLITATFVGYRAAGTLGALVATISIFLPAFLMTIAAGSSLKRFRNNALVQSFLRGISPAVVGLLVAAALSIGRAGIHTWIGLAIAIAAVIVLVRFRPNALWVILGAGAIRLLFGLFVS